jgi:hypothetical protein
MARFAFPLLFLSALGCSAVPNDPPPGATGAALSSSAEATAAPSDVCGGSTGLSCPLLQFCDAPAGACWTPNVQGTCKPIAATCLPVAVPVCGCDGNTYENDCFRIQAGVPLVREGACPPPPPPAPLWDASCRVVLEWVWGTDVQSYYGIARGELTPQRAVDDARAQGLAECESAASGHALLKCTVDTGQCTATQAP